MRFKLKEVCLKVTDGSHFSPKAQEKGYPMFSVKDMMEYGFDYLLKPLQKEDLITLLQNSKVRSKPKMFQIEPILN